MMKNLSAMIAGAGMGASALYLLDPSLGKRRRALLRDQARSSSNDIKNFIDVGLRDLKHRLMGVAGRIRYHARGRHVNDRKLRARVESRMGRFVSHPKALDVDVMSGIAIIKGHILEHELNGLVRAVLMIPGIRGVRNELTPHTQAENFPSLQGGLQKTGFRPDILKENWSPATRLLCGAASTVAAAKSWKRPRARDKALLGASLILLSRCVSNRPLSQLLGVASDGRGIRLQKHLLIHAPIQEVFAFFREPTNFPQVMLNVREVRNMGEGRSFWSVRGPAGKDMTWTARITRLEPNRLIVWETGQDSQLAHTGSIRLEPAAEASTRIMVQLNYHAPGGVIGQVAATVLGANPRIELESDLLRMKTFLETGKPAHDVASRHRMQQGHRLNPAATAH